MPTVSLADPAAPLAQHAADGERTATLVLVVGIAVLAAAYGRGVQELWARRGRGAVVPAWRAAAFGAGLLTVLASQLPPVDAVAERSFAGHMAQHMILLVVSGPLLAAGAAGLPLALAAPAGLRRRWARWRASALSRWLRRPALFAVLAVGSYTVALWSWHLPGLYLAALHSVALHGVEHLSFLGAAWLLWSAVLGAAHHRLAPPVGFLLLFASMMATTALGAALTFAPAPLYPADALAPGSPLADQQRAGLVMWIPMDVLVLAAGAILFLGWLVRLDRISPPHRGLPAVRPGAPVGGSPGSSAVEEASG